MCLRRLRSSETITLSELDAETQEWTNHNASSHALCLVKVFRFCSPEGARFKSNVLKHPAAFIYLFIYLN